MAVFRHRLVCVASLFACALALPAQGRADVSGGSPADEVSLPSSGDSTDVPADEPEPASEPLAYDPLFDDDPEVEEEFAVNDPFESGNRVIYEFNRRVFQYVWDPLASGYRFVIPTPARHAVRRVFDNLNAPIYFANHVLQLEPVAAAETLGAFAMNVSFGVGGLFDTASGVGWELKEADFGETLALYGAGSGPYLMAPFLGPTTVRDGVGFVIDRGFHPATYFFGIPFQLIGYGGIGFAHLEESIDQLTALEESSLDPYAVLRSAYIQDREGAIAERRSRGR